MTLKRVEKFLTQTGMAWTKFGRLVAGDPRLVADLRNGREPRPDLTSRIENFISTHTPNRTETQHVF
ncbi:MAG: hypothetical protein RLY97_1216 [Pseudomonadota bacterium]|jgi:hypothetical protein